MAMHSQSGSAFVYILIAIALLAALTVTTMQPSSQQAQTQNVAQIVNKLNSQVGFIQSAVQECIITYPGGEAGVNTGTDSNDSSSSPGANSPYPVRPNASHLTSPASNRKVENLRCPGNPGGNNSDHAPIFGGSSGRFLPQPPDLFDDWKWYNGDEGVFFWISTTRSDPFIETAMKKLNGQFSDCQLDWGTGLSMPSDDSSSNPPQCGGSEKCLRYWMVLDNSAPSHSESGCP